MNCIRIAINYRHFEGVADLICEGVKVQLITYICLDDLNPRVLKDNAFKHLDRAIALCAAQSIYTVIDMHTAPGGQSGGWHSDSGIHIAKFWVHKDFQDRLVWLWIEIAKHYKDNPWVVGYNVLNEPADPHPTHSGLITFYDRVYTAIREVDPLHILFLDGNTFATDFTYFPENSGERWKNTAYAFHDYAVYGFPNSPEPYERSTSQLERLKKTYERKRQWIDEKGLCAWNGEWGPVYARKEYDTGETDQINERRYMVLEDQLKIYAKVGRHFYGFVLVMHY